ncbi:redoxin domain-containing protein [Alcanivorax sp. DP30]|nr:redoxin domain-containing protein [Alcanivorax sp. DP30]
MPAAAFVILIAFLTAAFCFQWWQKRRHRTGNEKALWLIVLAGLLGARLAFLWRYQEQYPGLAAMLDIRDGGWWWPGAILAVPVATLLLWRSPQQRAGLLVALGAGAASAAATVVILLALRDPVTPLPDTTLYTLQGEPVSLKQVSAGQLTLINLWASWCPPCRREMPVLQAAQTDYPQLRIVLANQGEQSVSVRRYLLEQALQFDFLLLDPHTSLSEHAGSSGLPLTLLVDAAGNELARHFGPLSAASLHHFVQPHLPGASP